MTVIATPRGDQRAGKTGSETLLTQATLLCLAIVLSGCGGDQPTDPAVVSAVEVRPPSVTLRRVGDSVQLRASGTTDRGSTVPDFPVTWSSSDASVATVDVAGVVRAVSSGVTEVMASTGSIHGTSRITVDLPIREVLISPDGPIRLYWAGATASLTAIARDEAGGEKPGSLTWASSEDSVATVGADGRVTAVGDGTATVWASAGGIRSNIVAVVVRAVTEVEVRSSPPPFLAYRGARAQLTATAMDAAGRDVPGAPYTWATADTTVAAVTDAGVLVAIDRGETSVRARVNQVESSPLPVTVSVSDYTAYVGHPSSGSISVVSTATNSLVASATVGREPSGMSVTPDGRLLFVANEYSGTVSVISTETNTVTGTISVGGAPSEIVFTPDGSHAYVANTSSGTTSTADAVTVLSAASGGIVTTVPLGASVGSVEVSPDGAFVYATAFGSNTVSVISTATHSVVATMSGDPRPADIVFTPDGSKAYVSNQVSAGYRPGVDSHTVSVISTDQRRISAVIGVGIHPWRMAVTPDGETLLVANRSSDEVSVISTSSDRVIATIRVGSSPFDLAVTPDGRRAYVTNYLSDQVSVIDLETNRVIETVDVGSRPWGVAVTPDGALVYMASARGQSRLPTLWLIATATNQVVGTLDIGNGSRHVVVR